MQCNEAFGRRIGRFLRSISFPAAILVLLGVSSSALAQDPGDAAVIGTATLPRDLTPWGMFLNADPIVKGVLIGLVLASVVTWTVWLAKTIEIFLARRRVRSALTILPGAASLSRFSNAWTASESRSASATCAKCARTLFPSWVRRPHRRSRRLPLRASLCR